ncbi:MAG TPA: hypothetical protein VFS88_06475 [Micavibrio sp.]|nr:hypothetical protein [Micavibrio sp.]
MSSGSRVENVLIVLSPLSQAFMQADAAIDAARDLRGQGAMRADLMVDPRLDMNAARHLSVCPVPDFTMAARSLSGTIFAPLVGRSDVQDFSSAVGQHYARVAPDLFTLSHVGSLFAQAKIDGNHLGLALYAALHGKSYDRKSYTHLLYPDMTHHARGVLATALGGNCVGAEGGHSYGVSIDLKSLRERIAALTGLCNSRPAARLQ